jgi:hypothetical protein
MPNLHCKQRVEEGYTVMVAAPLMMAVMMVVVMMMMNE